MPHPETQIAMARPHPTPQKHDSPIANPNGTAQQSADLTKRQVSKTSVSGTSSKSHTSSLQNEPFVRDFLQNSHVKVCKTSVSYETSSKSQAETNTHRSTHITQPCQAVLRLQPLQTTSAHTPQSHVTATFTSTTTTIPCACHDSFRVHTSNAHQVLRLPQHVTCVTPRNLTTPCACHENRTSTSQNPHKVMRLPRKVTISSHVSFNKICTTCTTRLE